MDHDDFDESEPSDSDAIDEDLERHLYGAIFFGADSRPSGPVEGEQDVVLNNSSKDLSETCSSYSKPVLSKNGSMLDEESPQLHALIDLANDWTDEMIANKSVVDKAETTIKELVGSVVVSSFRDQSDADDNENDQQPCAEDEVSETSPSTNPITEESECDSVCGIVQNSKLLCSTPRVFSTPARDSENIILGVSKEASSIVCNADDSVVIAKMLETSSKDPSFWRIDHEDRLVGRSKKSRDRYFNDSKNSVCAKCEKKGHLTIECRRVSV